MTSVYHINNKKYKVINKIGGDDENLYLCRAGFLQTRVLKKINNCATDEDKHIFVREFELLRSLNHPNIIKVYDCGRERLSDEYFMVLEQITGGTLTEDIQKYPEKVVLVWFFQSLQACHYLHAQGIVHGDIKRDNIMVENGCNIKIIDFNLACHEGEPCRGGSLAYVAPENLPNPELSHATCAADIYALGVTFYWLLTGVHPYYPVNFDQSLNSIYFDRQPKQPTKLNRSLSPIWDDLLMELVCTDADRRIQAGKRVIDDILPFVNTV